jgi:uncharacterized Zn finger protein
MSELPSLAEADIRNLFDSGSFSRGRGYYLNGHIIDPNRRGDMLMARCVGSRPQPYHVEATLKAGSLLSADCSCPIGGGGRCKHVVALLLTWIHQPESFVVMEDVTTALQSYSKEELVLLIRMMLNRHPDLLSVVQMPLLGTEQHRFDPMLIRKRIREALRSVRYSEWDEFVELPEAVMYLLEVADYQLEAGRWTQAETIHRIILEEALDRYEATDDEGVDLISLLMSCVHGLGACLGHAEAPDDRERIVSYLLEILDWSTVQNSISLTQAVGDALVEHAMPEERRRVAATVRQKLPALDETWPTRWRRRVYGQLLLDLGADDLDDTAFLELCRETGQIRKLVERLLQLERLDEALDVTREAGDQVLLDLAELFVSGGQMAAIEKLLLEREERSRSSTLTEWLRKRALDLGDHERALALDERIFWREPSLASYAEWRHLGEAMGRWQQIRSNLWWRLVEEDMHALLIQIYLDEGELARALESLEQLDPDHDSAQARELRMRTAEAAERAFPQESLILYGEEVELLIAARGRENYHQAAQYLRRMRDLYLSLGQDETWDAFIAGLRADNARLYALRDEMTQVGV